MRSFDYVRLAARDVRRQPLRSLLTVTALAISTAIVVTLGSLTIGARQAVVSALSPDNSLSTVTVTSTKSGAGGLFGNVQVANDQTSKLDDATVSQLAKIPHVQSVSPRAFVWEFNTFGLTNTSTQYVAQTQGIGAETASTLPLSAGREFVANSAEHEVILGAAYARQLGGDSQNLLGKTISITTQKGYRGDGAAILPVTATQAQIDAYNKSATQLQATVVGITTDGSNQNSLFIPLGWAHQVRTEQYWMDEKTLKKTDQLADNGYTSIVLRADSATNVPVVAAAVDSLGYGEVSALGVLQKLTAATAIVWVVLGAIAVVALIAASLGIVNTMLMAVSEQRTVIAIWRACGAPKKQISRQFVLHAAILGLLGGVIGAATGFGITQVVNQHIAALLAAQQIATVDLPAAPWWLLGSAAAITVLFGVLAGAYPAWRAARQDPAIALAGQ
ncbi:MAG TPA: ABC transporter permease [Candidatus Saccharimonas sp.]|nr:ABC transporter permease [Candidatus Saccharimonas sp.]